MILCVKVQQRSVQQTINYRTLALYKKAHGIDFELCCFVVGVFSFQLTQLSGFVLNGKVMVVSKGACYCMICHEMVIDNVST
jgi:hypothetical protein